MPGGSIYGFREPSNIMRSPKDGYYYIMFQAIIRVPYMQAACVARTENVGAPGSWRAWNGNAFAADLSKGDTCAPLGNIGVMHESVTYNTFLKNYLLIGIPFWTDVQGVYAATSEDMIHWIRSPQPILAVTPIALGGRFAYPSLLDEQMNATNFDIFGQYPHLYIIRMNESVDRDILRIPLYIQ